MLRKIEMPQLVAELTTEDFRVLSGIYSSNGYFVRAQNEFEARDSEYTNKFKTLDELDSFYSSIGFKINVIRKDAK